MFHPSLCSFKPMQTLNKYFFQTSPTGHVPQTSIFCCYSTSFLVLNLSRSSLKVCLQTEYSICVTNQCAVTLSKLNCTLFSLWKPGHGRKLLCAEEKGQERGQTGLLYTEIRQYTFVLGEQNTNTIIPFEALLNGIMNSHLLFKAFLFCLTQPDTELLTAMVQVQFSN